MAELNLKIKINVDDSDIKPSVDRAELALRRLGLTAESITKSLKNSRISFVVELDTKKALADLAALKTSLKSQTVTIGIRLETGAASALMAANNAVQALSGSAAAGIPILSAYNAQLDDLKRNALEAANALKQSAGQAGKGIGGSTSTNTVKNDVDDSGLRRHAAAVLDTANKYKVLAAQIIATKSAVAVLTSAAVGALPVLGQMATVAGAAFGTALATNNVAAMSKELTKLAETTGASIDGLQKWRLAARFEGVAADLNKFGDMSKVFSELSGELDKLGTKDGEDFAKSLKAIGLSAQELKNMKPDEALLKIGEALAKTNMSTRDKNAFLGAISKDAANLLPLLEKTGQKFNEIADYASKVGAIQSDAQLAAMKQTNTELSYFKVGLEGVQTQLSAVGSNVINTLAPNIKQLFIDAKAPINDWSIAVDTALKKFKADLDESGSWGEAFGRSFESMYPTLYQFLSSAGKFGKGYGEAFIGPMLATLKSAYANISTALGGAGGAEAIGAAIGTGMRPVIGMVEGVSNAIVLLINNWDALKAAAAFTPVGLAVANWDSIKAVLDGVGNGIRAVGEAFGILNPATTENVTGTQILIATLGALAISGTATRLALGAIGATFTAVGYAIKPLILAVSAIPTVLGAAGTVMSGFSTALGFVAGAIKAVALAAVANPIGALIAVIAGGAALLIVNWEKVGSFFTGLWDGIKAKFEGFLNWWNGTTFTEKVADIKANTVDVVREKYTQFSAWWSSTTYEEKIADIKAGAIDLAKSTASSFKAWWDGTKLKEWVSPVATSALITAKAKAEQFTNWWSNTTFIEKIIDINVAGIGLAKTATQGFMSWWAGSSLKAWVLSVKADALAYVQQKASQFSTWWSSWTLKSVVADVTATTLIFAYEKAKEFAGWLNSWTLPKPELKLDFSIIETVKNAIKGFINWISTIEFKLPEIKLPDVAALGKTLGNKLSNVAKDGVDGFVQGFQRFTNHVAGASSDLAGVVDPAMRKALKTNSPSKITEAIGADTAAGLGIGIEKGGKAVKSAAEKTAQGAADAFKSIMEGITKQTLQLTSGDEAARRYELGLQGITDANQNAVIAAEAHIKKLEEQKKKTDEAKAATEAAAKAYKDAMERLQGQVIALTQGEEAGRRYELELQGIVGANQSAVIAAQNHVKALEEQKKKADESAAALEAAKKAVKESAQSLEIATKAIGLNDEQVQALTLSYKQGYTPEMARAQAADEAKTKKLVELREAQNKANESLKDAEKALKLAREGMNLTDVQLRALTLSHEKGYTSALANAVAATEAQAKALQDYRVDMQNLHNEQSILEARLRGGESAARAAELALKGYNAEQIAGIQGAEAFNKKLNETIQLASGIGDAIAEGLFSGDWKSAGQSILGDLKSSFIDPLQQNLSGAIKSALTGGGGAGGGLLGGLTNSIKGIFGSITSSISGLFGGGALGGLMGAAAPVALIAGIGTMLKGLFKKEGNLVFSQGMQQGQQLTGQGGHNGQEHWRQTDLGLIGATSGSNKIGRQEGFVPEFHKALDAMVALDKIIASSIPASVEHIKGALSGLEVKGFSTAEILKQRYSVVLSALPEELQKAMLAGKSIMSLTSDEIITKFELLGVVAQSGLIPSLQSLGLDLGKTKESALAAAFGLTDLMGGIDKVKAASDFYYQEFFSDEQRKAIALQKASADVAAFNRSLGLTGSAAINSHAEFVQYVKSLDLTTEAGRNAYAAAMQVAGSMDTVADAYKQQILNLQQALPSLENLNLRIGNTGSSALTAVNGLASLMGGIDKLTQAANTYYDQFFSDEEKKKQALANAAADVDRFNQSLGLSGKSAIDTHAEFRRYIESLNLQTEAGRKAYAEAMKIVGSMDALADTGKSLDDVIGSLPKKLYAKALAMAGLGDAVDKAATGSTDALTDVNRSLKSLGNAAGATAQAIEAAVNQALRAANLLAANDSTYNPKNTTATAKTDGSHALGLDYVPKDGYIAELHKGEMVLTARQASAFKAGAGQQNMAVSVRPQLSIVVNNNTNARVNVQETTDADGKTTAVLTIEEIEKLESALSDRARRGKGLANTFVTVGRR